MLPGFPAAAMHGQGEPAAGTLGGSGKAAIPVGFHCYIHPAEKLTRKETLRVQESIENRSSESMPERTLRSSD